MPKPKKTTKFSYEEWVTKRTGDTARFWIRLVLLVAQVGVMLTFVSWPPEKPEILQVTLLMWLFVPMVNMALMGLASVDVRLISMIIVWVGVCLLLTVFGQWDGLWDNLWVGVRCLVLPAIAMGVVAVPPPAGESNIFGLKGMTLPQQLLRTALILAGVAVIVFVIYLWAQ